MDVIVHTWWWLYLQFVTYCEDSAQLKSLNFLEERTHHVRILIVNCEELVEQVSHLSVEKGEGFQ